MVEVPQRPPQRPGRLSVWILGTIATTLLSGCVADSGNRNYPLFGDALGQAVNQAAQRQGGRKAQAIQAVMNSTSVSSSLPGASRTDSAGSASGRTVPLDHGEPFYPHYIVEYWRQPGPDSQEGLVGNVADKLLFGNKLLKQPGVADLRRKMGLIVAELRKHPALNPPRGASLRAGGCFCRGGGEPMGTIAAGEVSLLAYGIFPDDPKTRRFPDGSYHTPGEGDSLTVTINDPDVLEEPRILGTYKGMTLLSHHGAYLILVLNTDRPLLAPGSHASDVRAVLNPDLIDPKRPRSDIQFLAISVGAASSTWSAIAQGKQSPTSPIGRLLGAAFNTDWDAVLRKVN